MEEKIDGGLEYDFIQNRYSLVYCFFFVLIILYTSVEGYWKIIDMGSVLIQEVTFPSISTHIDKKKKITYTHNFYTNGRKLFNTPWSTVTWCSRTWNNYSQVGEKCTTVPVEMRKRMSQDPVFLSSRLPVQEICCPRLGQVSNLEPLITANSAYYISGSSQKFLVNFKCLIDDIWSSGAYQTCG